MPERSLFRKGVESKDLDLMLSAFSEGASLHSPVTFQPFEGRAAIRQLLGIILDVFEDFRYTDELDSAFGAKALVFSARIGEREVDGIDLIRFDASGFILDLTVMVRPRSAIEALLAAVAPRLASARGDA